MAYRRRYRKKFYSKRRGYVGRKRKKKRIRKRIGFRM